MTAEVEHGPGMDDPSGQIRCEGCGEPYPCEAARSGPRPLLPGEWDVLRSLDIDVGFSIYRRAPLDSDDRNPVGGVVVGSFTDDDGSTVFRVIGFPGGRHHYTRLRLAELEPSTIGLPNAAVIRSYARKLAEWVGRQKGAASGEELDLLSDAVTLFRAI